MFSSRHKLTVISPKVLEEHGIPYYTIVQRAGEIMITYPRAYHFGLNHGYNCAESTNFATPRWVDIGKRASRCTCDEKMTYITMDPFVQHFQPDTGALQ